MKTQLILLIIFTGIISISANSQASKRIIPNGDYTGGPQGNPIIKLSLNSDFSFSYYDGSNSSKPIDTKGNWSLRNNKIELNSEHEGLEFHKVWKVDGFSCIKSRKGIAFYRLCQE